MSDTSTDGLGDAPGAVHPDATWNGKTAPGLATEAYDAVLGINHLTRGDASRLDPRTLYRTLSGLTRVAELLPDSLAQLDAMVQAWVADGRMTVTGGSFVDDPAGASAAVSDLLTDRLLPLLGQLRGAMGNAQAALAYADAND